MSVFQTKYIKNGKLYASWCCQEIKNKLLKRYKLYKRQIFFHSKTNLVDLTNHGKEIKKLIRQAKRNEEISVADLSTENPKSFFSYVNNRKGIRYKITQLKDSQGVLQTDDEVKAN